MTAATVDPGDVRKKSRFEWFSDHWLIKIVIITISVFWLIPSLGLLVTSFRPALDIASSGWWTVSPISVRTSGQSPTTRGLSRPTAWATLS